MDKLAKTILIAREAIETITADFTGPDDDFMPTIVMEDKEGKRGIVGLDPAFLTDYRAKDVLAAVVMPQVLRSFSAVSAAFISSAWSASYDKDHSPEDQPPPSLRDDREEVVMYTAVTATRHVTGMARITRTGDAPPTVGEWTEMSDGVEGRFITGLRTGLARQG